MDYYLFLHGQTVICHLELINSCVLLCNLAKVFSISLLLSKLIQFPNVDLDEAMSLADNVGI